MKIVGLLRFKNRKLRF